jgi:hypothetical protein
MSQRVGLNHSRISFMDFFQEPTGSPPGNQVNCSFGKRRPQLKQ